jgi:hypothetical protein
MECPSNEEAAKKKAEFKAKMASGEVEIVEGKIVDHGVKEKVATRSKGVPRKGAKKVARKKKVVKKIDRK